MPDTKISAGADPVTLVATDKVPLARSASTTAYAATMAEFASYTSAAYVPNYYVGSPAMDGTAAPGTAAFVSRGDHVHPSDTTRLPLSGGTISGSLTVTGPVALNSTMTVGGYFIRPGTGGAAGANLFNFSWLSPNMTAWIDNVSVGVIAWVSDERLKSDIAPTAFDGLAAVLAMPLFQYRWKDHSELGKPVDDPTAPLQPIGFVAQRSTEAMPSAITQTVEQEGDAMHVATLNPLVLLAAAYDAIKRLATRVETLEQLVTGPEPAAD